MSSDMVNQWLANASRFPLLSASQEVTLGNQVRAWLDTDNPDAKTVRRGQRARNRMMQSNLRLVSAVAKKYLPRTKENPRLSQEDLLQEGCIGLARAVEKFDPATGYKFSTYAYWWIRQSCGRYCDINVSSIKITPQIHHLVMRWRYRPEGQTLEEFAAEVKQPAAKLEKTIALWKRAQVTSLDRTIVESGDTLIDLLSDDALPQEQNMQFIDALEDLREIPEIRDALAVLELSANTPAKEMAELLGCMQKDVPKQLKDLRALVREHAPEHVREQVCGVERKQPVRLLPTLPAVKPAPVRELVAVGCHTSSVTPMSEAIAAPTANGHTTSLEAEAMNVIAAVQSEATEEAPKPTRKPRRTKAEMTASRASEAVVVSIDGTEYQGTPSAIAAVVKAMAA